MATTYKAKGKIYLAKSQFDAKKAAGTLQTGVEYMVMDNDDTPYVTESQTPLVKKIAISSTNTSNISVLVDIKNPITIPNINAPKDKIIVFSKPLKIISYLFSNMTEL